MLAPFRMLCCTEYLTPSSARKLAGAHYAPLRQKRNFLRQYRIILSADTASEVRQLLGQKRR